MLGKKVAAAAIVSAQGLTHPIHRMLLTEMHAWQILRERACGHGKLLFPQKNCICTYTHSQQDEQSRNTCYEHTIFVQNVCNLLLLIDHHCAAHVNVATDARCCDRRHSTHFHMHVHSSCVIPRLVRLTSVSCDGVDSKWSIQETMWSNYTPPRLLVFDGGAQIHVFIFILV